MPAKRKSHASLSQSCASRRQVICMTHASHMQVICEPYASRSKPYARHMRDICKTYADLTAANHEARRGEGGRERHILGEVSETRLHQGSALYCNHSRKSAKASAWYGSHWLWSDRRRLKGTGPNGAGPNGSCRPYLSHAPSIAFRKTFTAAEPAAGTIEHRMIMMGRLPPPASRKREPRDTGRVCPCHLLYDLGVVDPRSVGSGPIGSSPTALVQTAQVQKPLVPLALVRSAQARWPWSRAALVQTGHAVSAPHPR